jgi:hypothetical protein
MLSMGSHGRGEKYEKVWPNYQAHLWNRAKALAGLSSPTTATPTGAVVLPGGVVGVSITR